MSAEPTVWATVRKSLPVRDCGVATCIVVELIHEVVNAAVPPNDTDVLRAILAKFKPLMVTDCPDEVAKFEGEKETTGESNVNPLKEVETNPEIVITAWAPEPYPAIAHWTVVPLVQALV